MGQRIHSRYCRHCKRHVAAVQHTANHVLHLLLSILTVGVWLPVWFLSSCTGSPMCPHCGRPCRSRLGIVIALLVGGVAFMAIYGALKGQP